MYKEYACKSFKFRSIIKCDLCSAEFKYCTYEELKQRLKRHTDFHNIKIKHATSNINFGIPKYSEV